MARSRYDSSTGAREQNHAAQYGQEGTLPVKPKHQEVGCFTYLGFLFGAFGVLAGAFCYIIVATDMPGRGDMPPVMWWIMIITYLFPFGLLPLALSIRSVLRVRRVNKVNDADYRREMAKCGQVNTNLNEQYPWRY